MSDVSKGDKVFVRVSPGLNNDDPVAFGFVTKVVGEDEEQTLNVRALLDTGADLRLTNIQLIDGEDSVVEVDADGNTRVYDAPKVAWLAS